MHALLMIYISKSKPVFGARGLDPHANPNKQSKSFVSPPAQKMSQRRT